MGSGRIVRAKTDFDFRGSTIRAGEPIHLGDDVKSAISDGFKKCATFFGVGQYLYDGDVTEQTPDAVTPSYKVVETLSTNQGETVTNITAAPTNGNQEMGVKKPILDSQKTALQKLLDTRQVNKEAVLKSKNVSDIAQLDYGAAFKLIVELNSLPIRSSVGSSR